jgi:peptide/nickel transport system substrate-binding protein
VKRILKQHHLSKLPVNTENLKNLPKKEWHLPFSKKISAVIGAFTLTEKIIFYFFVVVFFLSALTLLWQVNNHFLVSVPDYGGTLTEGVIGTPRFINPLLALSDSDRDLSELVYSGLLRANSDGTLIPDLAQSWTVSPDGLTYTFIIKDNAVFQDGTPVTADDVVYTVEKAQDPGLQSPRASSWNGVTVTKVDNRTVQFTLLKPYAPFIQNTTLGILPKHIWNNVTNDEFPFSEYNTKPIGSGPYQIGSISYTGSGLPSEYHLTSFKNYTLGQPYITTLVIKSYPDETTLVSAFKGGNIDSLYGISPDQLAQLPNSQADTKLAPLPRVFGLFFNQNVAPVFAYAEVRQALSDAVDKQAIVNSVLDGYGQPIDGPIPPQTLATSGDTTEASSTEDTQIAQAQTLLTKNGWTKDPITGIFEKKDGKQMVSLTFSISTGDAPELKATAQMLQQEWEAMGAQVAVKIFETSDLNQNIIRPRKYDALLFGEIVGRDLDLYPFWHSSERADPGLNIALYANIKADKTLESLRATNDPTTKATLLSTFTSQVNTDTPAVFLYSPYFIYIIPSTIHNVTLGSLNSAAERFSNVYQWYIETNKVWGIFQNFK